MRTRLLAVLAALCLLIGLAGCDAASAPAAEGPAVITTVFPAFDFVRQLGGQEVTPTLLLKPGQESHSYEPSPKDIIAIQECDLFVYVGGEAETWVEDILASMDNPPATLKLVDCVDLLSGEHEEDIDPHVWTSPKNALTIVDRLERELVPLVSDTDALHSRANAYKADLLALDTAFTAAAKEAGRPLVFADRFPFLYFTATYGLTARSAYAGCDAHAEPSAATVAELIDLVKSQAVPVVLYIEFSNQQLADSLCEATGATKRLFHSCHNVTAEEMNKGVTYLSLMEGNLAVLKEALA